LRVQTKHDSASRLLLVKRPFYKKIVYGLVSTCVQADYLRSFVLPELFSVRERLFDRMQAVYIHEAAPEQERYQRTLVAVEDCVGANVWNDVLEIGCSQGLFTRRLAERCNSVTAWDISPSACKATALRCADSVNVHVEQMDMQRDRFEGKYDLVFALDTLQYLHGRRRFENVVNKIVRATRCGGHFVFSGWRVYEEVREAWWQRWFPEGIDQHLALLSKRSDLRLIRQEFHGNSAPPHIDYVDHLFAIFEKLEPERPFDPSSGTSAYNSKLSDVQT
jgi:SAM-dependent methyltransferase